MDIEKNIKNEENNCNFRRKNKFNE